MQSFGQRLPGTSHSVGLAMTGDGNFYTGYRFNNAAALIHPTGCRWAADGSIISLGLLPGGMMSVPSDRARTARSLWAMPPIQLREALARSSGPR